MMAKMNADRTWWLKQWSRGGWSIGNPMKCDIKKWREHTEALVKAGYLEGHGGLYRITDAGLDALTPSPASK